MSLPRYVELIRVSTAAQAERDTPALQRAALERLRQSRPGRLVARIEALGVSGARGMVAREDLQRLKDLTGKYDELRVYAVDRLTRADDPRERFAIYGLVSDTGAKIVDAAGRVVDPADEMGELDYYLQTLFASRERRKIAARSKAGCARKAAEGKLPRGLPPYGRAFDKAVGAWSLHREEAATYRRMFTLCIQGLSIRRICDRLNAEGAPTRRGGIWHWSQVGAFLRDRSAIGEWTAHGVAMTVPAVVDRVTFEAAQKKLTANHWEGAGPRAIRHPALLRKLLTCGTCGATMYVRSARKRGGGRVFYYQCGTARDKRADEGCSHMHEVLRVDALVRERVRDFLDDPSVLSSALDVDRRGELAEELAEARRELAQVDREERNLVRLGRRVKISPRVMAQQVEEVAKLRADAEARVAAAQAMVDAGKTAEAMRDQMEARLAFLRRRIARASQDEWRELIGLLFPRGKATGLTLHQEGRIEGRGTLDLGAEGAKALENARSKLSAASYSVGQTGAIPLSLRVATRSG